MSSTTIPDRTVTIPVDELIEARNALELKAKAIRKTVPRLPTVAGQRDALALAERLDRIAGDLGRVIRERPLPPSLPDIEEELVG